jgi:hypothetical protein
MWQGTQGRQGRQTWPAPAHCGVRRAAIRLNRERQKPGLLFAIVPLRPFQNPTVDVATDLQVIAIDPNTPCALSLVSSKKGGGAQQGNRLEPIALTKTGMLGVETPCFSHEDAKTIEICYSPVDYRNQHAADPFVYPFT